jgi:hypothetical protein
MPILWPCKRACGLAAAGLAALVAMTAGLGPAAAREYKRSCHAKYHIAYGPPMVKR